MQRRPLVAAGAVTALVAGLAVSQLAPGSAPSAQAAGLVGYGGCDELLAHYRSELRQSATAYGFGQDGYGIAVADAVGGAERQSAPAGADAVGSGPTGTNLQEQGVDEPDLVKLRDGRLVVLSGDRLRVLSTGDQPEVLGTLRLSGESSYGGELLLVGDRALVVQPGYRVEHAQDSSSDAARSVIRPAGTATTRVSLVDLRDDRPRLLEQATYDSQYVSARLVDGTVRLVTTKRPMIAPYYPTEPGEFSESEALAANRRAASAVSVADVLPQVERRGPDGEVREQGSAVSCTGTTHATTPTGVSTLLVVTLRPEANLEATDRTAVTTDGDLVYASADRLYVATSRWGTVGPIPLGAGLADSPAAEPEEVSTELHAFDTSSADSTRYLGSGTVPGYVLGRWALSHHEGALRVATTRQPPWDGERTGETSSMVVKLVERDGRLVETGRVGGLGRTEHIKAVRYFGDVAAVVTFRQTDPLYLLDLSGDPKVLGELKIPGFSTYLHPIGDGKLLGLGHDATPDGQVTGVQVSVFDIADLSRPTQVDRIRLGQGWSPALDDSRAFTYDPDRRLATFSFAGYDPAAPDGQPFAAVGVTVDRDGTLREAGRLALDQYSYAGRVLLDDRNLYAVSETGVVAGDADTWRRTGSVAFGTPGPVPYVE